MSIEVNATEQIIEVNATGSTIDINVNSQTVDVNATTSVIDVEVSNGVGPAGPGVPTGGTTGQVLKKLSNSDYDTYWALDGGGVPYTGATGDVDLGEYELKAGQVEFDQSPTGTAGVGVMRWNNTDGTLDLGLKGGNVTLQVGEDIVARVVNKTGGNLLASNYQVVRVSSAQGQRLAVTLAQGNNDNNSADTLGLVIENINNNQEGWIQILGQLTEVNTTGSLQGETWTDGDVLYLSPTTAGALTNVKPVAPQHIVVLGYVEYAHSQHGKIYVKVMNGWELGELHDVDTTGATDGQVLSYNAALGIWKPVTNAAGNIYTTDGTLTGNRTVTNNAFTLTIKNTSNTSAPLILQNTQTYGTGGVFTQYAQQWLSSTGTSAGYVLGDIGRLVMTSTIQAPQFYTGGTGFVNNGAGWGGSIGICGSPIDFGTNTYAGGGNNIGRWYSTGNLVIQTGGTFTDAGYKLDVQGTTRIKSTATSDAGQFVITDQTTSNNLFRFTGNGKLFIGTASFPSVIQSAGTNNNLLAAYNYLDGATDNTGTLGAFNIGSIGNISNMSLSATYYNNLYLKSTITTSYNSAVINEAVIGTVINGTSTGVMRGLFINPTITSGGTGWLAIQSTSGGAYFNTSSVAASAILQADSTTKGFLQPRMTTTQRNAISTPATGLSIYNTTTNTIDYYNGTSWVSGQTSITTGNLTETGSSILTISGGTNAVIGSGTTIQVAQASGSTNGFLSSTDWTTFNNKQNALTNPITGTGTSGQVAYWSGTNTQTGSNNLFWDNANTRLGVGTNAPAHRIDVSGGTINVSTNDSGDAFLLSNRGFIVFRDTTNTITNRFRAASSAFIFQDALFNTKTSISTNNSFTYFNNGGGNVGIGTTTDGGQRLQVNGTALFTGSVTGTGNSSTYTVTASSGVARSKSITSTLVAAANNDVLVGLDINPTFTNGAFTGVSNLGLRVTNADTILRGSGNTSATTALRVQNSDGTNYLILDNSGVARFDNRIAVERIQIITSANSLDLAGGIGSATGGTGIFLSQFTNVTNTSGTFNKIISGGTYAPTSGTGLYTNFLINNIINQTGGANGITRGLYVNPTLTAAADWRSIEWSNSTGWGLYGAGSVKNYLNGNLLIGTTTDGGQKLQVNGDTLMKGSGNTSATIALTVQNSDGTNILSFRNDKWILAPTGTVFNFASPGSGVTNASIYNSAGSTLRIEGGTSTATINEQFLNINTNFNTTAGTHDYLFLTGGATSTSGTAVFNAFRLTPTINQTGGANGITRGLYINPTLTSAADWRAIEVSSGGAYINTTSVNASAILQADSTTKGFLPPRMTTTQKNAIATPAAGLIVFDTTLAKLCVYSGTAWETITSI